MFLRPPPFSGPESGGELQGTGVSGFVRVHRAAVWKRVESMEVPEEKWEERQLLKHKVEVLLASGFSSASRLFDGQ